MRTARDYEDPYDDGPRPQPTFGFPAVGPVTRKILWITSIVGVLGFLLGDASGVRRIYEVLSLFPHLWGEWFPFLPVWQLGTYGLLHDTRDVTHLLFNMLAVYSFGSLFEGVVGSRRMAAWYFGSIAAGGAAQLVYAFASGRVGPMVGASGAVMFLVVAMATLQPNMPVFFFIVQMRLKTLALILIAVDLFRVVSALKGLGGDVAFVVHLTGSALGFVAVRQRWIWSDPVGALKARAEAREQASKEDDEKRLDALLERIHREGIGSLSARERAFLKRMSSRRGGGL